MRNNFANWVEVYRDRGRSRSKECALVLEALGIDHRIVRKEGNAILLVAAGDATRAARELADYEKENEGFQEMHDPAVPVSTGAVSALLVCWVLFTCYQFERHHAFSLNWREAGKTQAQLIRDGQWRRAVTALSLHADVSHLVSNMVFMSLFGVLVSQHLGSGLAWLSIVLAGAGGNLLNAFVQPAMHSSIGASTAVFGAIGILVAYEWRRRAALKQGRLRRWTPLVIGAVFLGFLGTSGEGTDVMAHCSGLLAGMVLGAFCELLRNRISQSFGVQLFFGCTALSVMGLAWLSAFCL